MIETLNQVPEVRDSLLDIEDKLRERGLLVRMTGDRESDVTLTYAEWGTGDARGPYLVISIDSSAPGGDPDESDAEAISDYVSDKLVEVAADWPQAAQTLQGTAFGQVVLVNGARVY